MHTVTLESRANMRNGRKITLYVRYNEIFSPVAAFLDGGSANNLPPDSSLNYGIFFILLSYCSIFIYIIFISYLEKSRHPGN